MSWLTSPAPDLVGVAVKVTLIYGTALLVLRVGERRTLAQWTTIDFVAAVAIGAIVGRTAVAKDQSYAVGAVALVTIVAVHRLASLLRFSPLFGKLQDPPHPCPGSERRTPAGPATSVRLDRQRPVCRTSAARRIRPA